MTNNDNDNNCNLDHDILIELKTMMSVVIDRFKELPMKCILHDEMMAQQKKDIDDLKVVIEKNSDKATQAWRFAIGSIVTILIAIAGWIVEFIKG